MSNKLVHKNACQRHASTAHVIVGVINALCGLGNGLLGMGHLGTVIGRTLSGKGVLGTVAALSNDFRFYSLVLLGLVIPGFLCLSNARGLMRGDTLAWRRSFWLSLSLLAVNEVRGER